MQNLPNGNQATIEVRVSQTQITINESAGPQQFLHSWNQLGFNDWKEFESLDLLVLCNLGDFEFYVNGKYIQSLASDYWHPNTGVLPKPFKIEVEPTGTVKFTKLQWTFSKKLFNNRCQIIYIIIMFSKCLFALGSFILPYRSS